MLKKVAFGIMGAGLLIGAGTVVFAEQEQSPNLNQVDAYQENNNSANSYNEENYEEMKPYMKRMHPSMSDQDMENMYKRCHGSYDNQADNRNEPSNPTNNSYNSTSF